MPLYRTPVASKDQPLIFLSGMNAGCATPYFQQLLLNISGYADQGASVDPDVTQLTNDVSSINTQLTVINSTLAGKAPTASPAFTGNPTAPTPTAGDNDTSIATTAFVTTHAVARSTFTAWAAATGTAERTTFATYTAPTASAAYDQTEMQGVMDHVQILSRRLMALIDDLKT